MDRGRSFAAVQPGNSNVIGLANGTRTNTADLDEVSGRYPMPTADRSFGFG